MNSTYVCLIPKHQNAETLRQYRPISLCNTVYKVVTKIIVNRIKPLLNKIIHPSQTSFIKGRRASDNAIIVHEVQNFFKNSKGKKGKIMIKIDLEKAFDKLECSLDSP